MKESMQPGIRHTKTATVTEDMAPPHLPAKVLSTPSMVNLVEWACLEAAQSHLDEGETTVGTHVNLSHDGPAMAGEDVEIEVALAEVNKRRLTFDVEVRSPRGAISTGQHQRAVVDLSRFG